MKKVILACFLLWAATINVADLSRIATDSFLVILETHEKIMDGIYSSGDGKEDHKLANSYAEPEKLLPGEKHPQYSIIPVQKLFPVATITKLKEQGVLEPKTTLWKLFFTLLKAEEIIVLQISQRETISSNNIVLVNWRNESQNESCWIIFRQMNSRDIPYISHQINKSGINLLKAIGEARDERFTPDNSYID